MANNTKVDYIFAGAGLSGLTLALELSLRPYFSDKKMILIDRDDKTRNNRTWCFWAKPEEPIPPVAHKVWSKCLFFGQDVSKTLEIAPFQYHMIRGLDFYQWAKNELSKNPNIQLLTANILAIDPEFGVVSTPLGDFEGSYIFNSAHYPNLSPNLAGKPVDGARWIQDHTPNEVPIGQENGHTFLLQHFKGWIIETPTPTFDPEAVTFMDYRLPQQDDTRFVYVLPFSPTKALVEFTVFSAQLCAPDAYDFALKNYLSEILGIPKYHIQEDEFGVIPMTDLPFSPHGKGRVIHIGTAGGFVKASSGYAFLRTQRKLRAFAEAWEKTGNPDCAMLASSKGYKMLDSIMLRVLKDGAVSGKTFFSLLFKKLPAPLVFRFLDEDASLKDVFRVLSSPPTWPFFRTALRQLPILYRILSA